MNLIHVAAAAAAAAALTGCKLIQAPVNMTKGLLQASGRALHLTSEGSKRAEDFQLNAPDVREALAGAPSLIAPRAEPPPAIARR